MISSYEAPSIEVIEALIAQHPLPEVEVTHHSSGEGSGPFTRDILGERLQAWAEGWQGKDGEKFTFEDTRAKDGFRVWCPGNCAEGWDGTKATQHEEVYHNLNDGSIVYVENGWPKLSCRHYHCGEGAPQGKKTWAHLQKYYDPKREFHCLPQDNSRLEGLDYVDDGKEMVPEANVDTILDQGVIKVEVVEAPAARTGEVEVPIAPRKGLYTMPESCMYGWCGQKARELQTPLGYAYPATVTVFAAMIEGDPGYIRPTLYTCLIGPVACSKSETIKRAIASINYADPDRLRWTVPGSDRGLTRMFGKKEQPKKKGEEEEEAWPETPKTRLLAQDELRNTMAKASISGSSLPTTLCTLWSQDEAGGSVASGVHEVLVKLNILGALKAEDPEEFAEVFGSETTGGLYDRFVYAIAPTGWTYNFGWVAHEEIRCATRPKCSQDIYQMIEQWRGVSPKTRGRLGEIALRWAYITAAANHDRDISVEGMRCALEFVDWQESIRGGFKAGLGDAIDAQCTNAILSVLEAAKGEWVKWSTVALKKNWYRKFGATVLARVRDSLVKTGETVEETEEDDNGRPKRTGRLRLRGD